MKKFYSAAAMLVAMTGMVFSSVSCKKDEPVKNPKVELAEGSASATELSFTVIPSEADECWYLCVEKDGDNVPSVETVMSEGKALEKMETTKVTVSDLTSETEYVVVAAASAKGGKPVVSEPLYMKTAKADSNECSVILTPGEVTETSVSFTVVPMNADKCSYMCMKAEGASVPTAAEIFEKGTALEKMEQYTATVSDLDTETEYLIYTAASVEGGEAVVSEELRMKTKKAEAGQDMSVEIVDVKVTYNSVTFTVVPSNAGGGKYTHYMKTDEFVMPGAVDAYDVYSKGKSLESVSAPQTVTIENLRADTEYYIMAAVESASSYDKVMGYVEIRTEKLPEPEEMPLATFTEASLNVYRKNNYVIEFKDADTQFNLDLIGSLNPSMEPVMEQHEYTYVPDMAGNENEWMISPATTKLTMNGEEYRFVEGKATIEYNVPEYRICGRMITNDNKAFSFEYSGRLPYPVSMTEGEIISEGGRTSMSLKGQYYSASVDFTSEITGEHTVGNGVAATSALSVNDGASYTFKSGNVTVTEDSENVYNVNAEVELESGDMVSVSAERISMVPPVDPGESEIVLTEVSAMGGPDMSGYLASYDITFKNEDWSFYFWIDAPGYYDEIPAGKYIYSSYGGGDISSYRINGPETSYNDIDEGTMNITKDGNIYTVEFEMVRTNGEKFIGKYVGEIECTDMSGGMYN